MNEKKRCQVSNLKITTIKIKNKKQKSQQWSWIETIKHITLLKWSSRGDIQYKISSQIHIGFYKVTIQKQQTQKNKILK